MTSFSRRDLVKGGAAMAGGLVLRARPVRAATKVRLLTNWFAEAEHGGFYQAVAAGLYDKAGLDVEIRQGNAQLNGMQVLLGGEADIIMSYDITILNGVEKGAPVKAFFTSFQRPDRADDAARDQLIGGVEGTQGLFRRQRLFVVLALAEATLRLHRRDGGA